MDEIGSLFMVGVYGKRATKDMAAHLKRVGAPTILLLARNIESPAQVRALTEELTQKLGRKLLFAIDHEGGWVTRFTGGVTCFPGNAALGRARDPKLARAVGAQMAKELSSLDIGLNLAPVLDVIGERYNPGILIRSFGSDPKLVGRLGRAFVSGIQGGGVAACAKHFPGKGAAKVDAHFQLPTINLTRSQLERHLYPFREAVKGGVNCVMTSHVRYPALGAQVATFSKRVVGGLIREEMGFGGVIISDDLCMGAVTASLKISDAAVQALEAGHDMLIIAHDLKAQIESADAIRERAAKGRLDRSWLDDSIKRISSLIESFPRSVVIPAEAGTQFRARLDSRLRGNDRENAGVTAGLKLSALISHRTIEVVQNGSLSLPLRPKDSRTLVLVPDFSEVKDRFAFEGGPRAAEDLVRQISKRWGRCVIKKTPIGVGKADALRSLIEKSDQVVFFCFEAMRFEGQKAVLGDLKKKAAKKSVVCLLRNPWDKGLLPPAMTAVSTYGYTLSQWREALALIFGKR